MIPVNPGQAGKEMLGQKVYAKLSRDPRAGRHGRHLPRLAFVMPVVEEALALKPKPQVIWMQLTVRNDEAAALAEAAGIKVVMDRCPKIEYGRLSSEISWMGINSRTLSSKRAQDFGGGVQRMGPRHRQQAATDALTVPLRERQRRVARLSSANPAANKSAAVLSLDPSREPMRLNSIAPPPP